MSEAPTKSVHRIWTATLPDGREVLVQLWDTDGQPSYAEIAFRERPDPQIVWGPPTRLQETRTTTRRTE
jgi:GTPase SAR1 family protein